MKKEKSKKTQIIDLSNLLEYYDKLQEIINKLFPEDIPLSEHPYIPEVAQYKHPEWVKAHFPLMLIIYRPKAGKLRKSKNEEVMFQNNMNVMTQVVWTADDFGTYKRKNQHKGFKNIVAAIRAKEDDLNSPWPDKQKPKKYKNFQEFAQMRDATDVYLRAMCDILQEHYPCDSHGQLRLL